MTKACLDFDYLEVEEDHAKGCSESPGRGCGARSLAWRTRALKSSLQWTELPWEQRDLALGPLVSRADASSIPRKLG